ncbi:hypothetical protein FS837_007972 [Tulasnella sp. UAMH 9824]|nr:hypothetical protein FS837_007972 [Tulasnella sp. UAMH 9824]
MAGQAASFIAKSIADNKIVTFRVVSRELSIHVNDAKNQLASYYSSNKGSGNSTYATFLVSGEVAVTRAPEPQNASSMDTSDIADSGSSSILERRIVLAGEEELEGPCASPHHLGAGIDAFSTVVKSQFTNVFSVHVYSLAANRVKKLQDAALLTASSITVRDVDGQRGVEHAKRVGMMVAPDVKLVLTSAQWTPSAGKTSMQPKAQPSKPKTAAADAPQRTTKSETSSDKKPGTLDWSKAKPKAEPSETAVSVKKDPSPVPPPKKATAKDWFKPKQAKTPEVKPEQSKPEATKTEGASTKPTSTIVAATKATASTAKPASKQSTARPASKQLTATSAKDSSSAPSGSKRATPSVDSEMEGSDKPERNVKPRLEASTSQPRLQKGRVLSDDDEEEEEEPTRKPKKSTKRKSEALTEDDSDAEEGGDGKRSRLQKGENAAEKSRRAKETREKELRKLVEDDDGDTEMQDTTMGADEEAEDSAPEHVPLTKHYKGMPKKEKPKKEVPTGIDAPKASKKKSKAPIGSNGKPKRKVTKSRVVKLPNGFMRTEDYSSYESASDDEPMIKVEEGASASKPAVVKPKAKPRGSVSSENESKAGSSTESKPKPKPLAKKKSTQSGTLNAFFKKA